MTWLWIMMIFVITGGELNAEMEHQTRRGHHHRTRSRWAHAARRWPTRSPKGRKTRPTSAMRATDSARAMLGGDRHDKARQRHRHTRRQGGAGQAASDRGATRESPMQPGAPLSIGGGLMLRGQLALAVAAGNTGRRPVKTRPLDTGPGHRRAATTLRRKCDDLAGQARRRFEPDRPGLGRSRRRGQGARFRGTPLASARPGAYRAP